MLLHSNRLSVPVYASEIYFLACNKNFDMCLTCFRIYTLKQQCLYAIIHNFHFLFFYEE